MASRNVTASAITNDFLLSINKQIQAEDDPELIAIQRYLAGDNTMKDVTALAKEFTRTARERDFTSTGPSELEQFVGALIKEPSAVQFHEDIDAGTRTALAKSEHRGLLAKQYEKAQKQPLQVAGFPHSRDLWRATIRLAGQIQRRNQEKIKKDAEEMALPKITSETAIV